jgi:hypothetical protein
MMPFEKRILHRKLCRMAKKKECERGSLESPPLRKSILAFREVIACKGMTGTFCCVMKEMRVDELWGALDMAEGVRTGYIADILNRGHI